MYILISKGSEIYKQLKLLQANMQKAHKATIKYIEKFGADHYLSINGSLSGGFSGIILKEKPKGWRTVFPGHYNRAYYPKKIKSNAEILQEIEKLPVVTINDLNNVLKYKPQIIGTKWHRSVGLSFHKGYMLMVTGTGCKYKLLPGMVEIKESEYITKGGKL